MDLYRQHLTPNLHKSAQNCLKNSRFNLPQLNFAFFLSFLINLESFTVKLCFLNFWEMQPHRSLYIEQTRIKLQGKDFIQNLTQVIEI